MEGRGKIIYFHELCSSDPSAYMIASLHIIAVFLPLHLLSVTYFEHLK